MRVNAGLLAFCRSATDEGWVSPEYVVFRLKEGAPFGPGYLPCYLTRHAGREDITWCVRRGVRARLYCANLMNVETLVSNNAAKWDEILGTMAVPCGVARNAVGPPAEAGLAATLFV